MEFQLFGWSRVTRACEKLHTKYNVYLPLNFLATFQIKLMGPRGDWGDGAGGFHCGHCYIGLLYIHTLPSHHYNVECCKNFWTKMCALFVRECKKYTHGS